MKDDLRWPAYSAACDARTVHSSAGADRSPDGSPRPFTKPKIAGITTSVSSVDDVMPPIIGTAMRCMISDPAPVLHMIGSRPAMMATTVIILGRTRSTAPTMMAS